MALDQEGLPARSLLLLATALLLFGIGGGLVGHMLGERQGGQRPDAAIQALGALWDIHRGLAQRRFAEATDSAATQLERAVVDLKAQVSMYHGCGAICSAIAHQFSAELLRAADAVRDAQSEPLPSWREVLQEGAMPTGQNARAGPAPLIGPYSGSTVIAAIALLCATVTLCFGMACFTPLKLRANEGRPV